ncbi:hypothetical protein [Bacillus gaemokensis]|uniref:Phage protein n=1 Tax=Bacillus gaemokensis TaxID=574375 RepID=A0A073KBE4_9BACI|nr:hypothetical protein [Bacillus gaemokensis]KEK23880.1 hypothetical protein BAGA_05410 [Bacillus gaemokensis]KYG38121.1 hypothetical protein AZF08_20445 [Bacillus gaemokensis]
MVKYKKGNVVVEAIEFTDSSKDMIFHWITHTREPIFIDGEPALKMRTLEGYVVVRFGDYVVKGVNGEFYSCKADAFHDTYKPINL